MRHDAQRVQHMVDLYAQLTPLEQGTFCLRIGLRGRKVKKKRHRGVKVKVNAGKVMAEDASHAKPTDPVTVSLPKRVRNNRVLPAGCYPTVLPVAAGEPPTGAECVTLTAKMIDAGRGPHGGFKTEQIQAIGVMWPPPHGWPQKLVGVRVTVAAYDRFLSARG